MRNDVHSPLQAELLAALFGIKMAREKNFLSVLLEMDSKVAVIEISKKSNTSCPWGSIIVDICSYFNGNWIILSHMYQEGRISLHIILLS